MSPLLPIVAAGWLSQAQPSPQTPPLPPAAAPVAVAASPSSVAQPAGQPVVLQAASPSIVLQQAAPTVYVVPPSTPANVVILQAAQTAPTVSVVQPATYTVGVAPAAPQSLQAVAYGTPANVAVVREPGPIHRTLGALGDRLAGLKLPKVRSQPVALVPVIGTAPAPAPTAPPPATNSAGLVEPAAIRPSKQAPR